MTTTIDTAADNPYEAYARLVRATAIADLLDALGWEARDCELATPEMWNLAATLADVRKPSGRTCDVVADLLRQRGRARDAVAAKAGERCQS